MTKTDHPRCSLSSRERARISRRHSFLLDIAISFLIVVAVGVLIWLCASLPRGHVTSRVTSLREEMLFRNAAADHMNKLSLCAGRMVELCQLSRTEANLAEMRSVCHEMKQLADSGRKLPVPPESMADCWDNYMIALDYLEEAAEKAPDAVESGDTATLLSCAETVITGADYLERSGRMESRR